MPLKELPSGGLQHLIGAHLSTSEWPPTLKVIQELSGCTKRGFLTRAELITVCRWKSPRAIRLIRRNRADTVRQVTSAAFAARNEEKKLAFLTSLSGVSVPMASSILMLTNPKRYGVMDVRVWQVLHTMGAVRTNAGGRGFGFTQWHRYLMILRRFAALYNVGARDIERTLFIVHTLYQKGTLYRR